MTAELSEFLRLPRQVTQPLSYENPYSSSSSSSCESPQRRTVKEITFSYPILPGQTLKGAISN